MSAYDLEEQEQLAAMKEWWQRYIEDRAFRCRQEIAAHQAEYVDLCRRGRDDCLIHVAKRLASPLYGNMMNVTEACKLLASAAASAESTATM